MTLMVGTPTAGARLISDVSTRAPGDVLAALRRTHGDPSTWTVNIGEIMQVVNAAEDLLVVVLVMGASGICRLTAGAALIAACAVDVPAGQRTEVRFRLTPNSERSARLAL